MNVLHKIIIAGVDCQAPGGGGSPEFYKRMIEIMPDKDRSEFAKLLETKLPHLTDKFQKMKAYEAWWLTRLVEHLWYPKIRKDVFWQSCRVGVNDSNVTLDRLERNLHNVLDKCVPGWKLASIYEGDDLSVPNVEYYMLGELGAARDRFLGLYPNATWPKVDEEALAERREAEAVAQDAKAADDLHHQRWIETFPEVRGWDEEAQRIVTLAQQNLNSAHGNRASSEELKQALAALDVVVSVMHARQRLQVKRLEDGLAMYGPDEGPERLEAESNLG